ncbi:hypothetical protein SARC_17997, partial [Sphaeroforma arctica JP610]
MELNVVTNTMDLRNLNATFTALLQNASARLAFGPGSPIIAEQRYATTQTISGTGALRLCDPTWGNHVPTFTDAGLELSTYRYYDPETRGLDLAGMLHSIDEIPDRSVILLHACAHNPTGVDPSHEEWDVLSQAIKKKNIFPVFDM